MKFLVLSALAFCFSAMAQPEVITSDFQLLNQVTNYKLYNALSKNIKPVIVQHKTEGIFKVTLPGLIECYRHSRARGDRYDCSLLKGGWKTHKETILSGRGDLELASWEKDGQRLYDSLSTPVTEDVRDGVGEDFVTHRVLEKSAVSCSGYEPNTLTALYSTRLEVSKDGERWYETHTATVQVMMERPVYECP